MSLYGQNMSDQQLTKPIKVRPTLTSPLPSLAFENSMTPFSVTGTSNLGDSSDFHRHEFRGNFKLQSDDASAFQTYKSTRSDEPSLRVDASPVHFSAASLTTKEEIRRTPGPSRVASEDSLGTTNPFQHAIPFASPFQRALDQLNSGASDSPNLMNIVDRILVGMKEDEKISSLEETFDGSFFQSRSVGAGNVAKLPSSEQQFLQGLTESLEDPFPSNSDVYGESSIAFGSSTFLPANGFFSDQSYSEELPISSSLDSKQQSFRQRDQFHSDFGSHLSNSWDSMDSGYIFGSRDTHHEQLHRSIEYQNQMLQSRQRPPPPPSLKSLQHPHDPQFPAASSFAAPLRSQSPTISYLSIGHSEFSGMQMSGPVINSSNNAGKYLSYDSMDFAGVSSALPSHETSSLSSKLTPKWTTSEPERAVIRKSGGVSTSHDTINSGSREKKVDSKKTRPVTQERTSQESAGRGIGAARPTVFEPVETPAMKAASKEFYKTIRQKERESLDAAKEFAMKALESMSEGLLWKVYAELADIAKRSDQFDMVCTRCSWFWFHQISYTVLNE